MVKIRHLNSDSGPRFPGIIFKAGRAGLGEATGQDWTETSKELFLMRDSRLLVFLVAVIGSAESFHGNIPQSHGKFWGARQLRRAETTASRRSLTTISGWEAQMQFYQAKDIQVTSKGLKNDKLDLVFFSSPCLGR